jgi:hypothetical protein
LHASNASAAGILIAICLHALVVDGLLALDDGSLPALDDDSVFLTLDARGLHAPRSAVPSPSRGCQGRPRHLVDGRLLSALVGGGWRAPRCTRRWPPPMRARRWRPLVSGGEINQISSTHARGERGGDSDAHLHLGVPPCCRSGEGEQRLRRPWASQRAARVGAATREDGRSG